VEQEDRKESDVGWICLAPAQVQVNTLLGISFWSNGQLSFPEHKRQSFTPKEGTGSSSETVAPTYRATRLHRTEQWSLNIHPSCFLYQLSDRQFLTDCAPRSRHKYLFYNLQFRKLHSVFVLPSIASCREEQH
jgi:hypothetical protein